MPVLTVLELFEKHLKWCKIHRAERTHNWYERLSREFAATLPAGFLATELRAFHVVEWVDANHQRWGQNAQRAAFISVTRPFSWAWKLGYLDVNPLRGIEMPAQQKRESIMTPDDFYALLRHVRDQAFRDALTFTFETGCRPQECRAIEARHIKLESHRIEFPPGEGKVKGRWRVIYLSPLAEAILKRLLRKNQGGPVFLNSRKEPWTKNALACRFKWLKEQLGTRFAMYDLRHCFATRKLKAGHDPITVAALLGHKNAKMLCEFYEGVSCDAQHLVDAMKPTKNGMH